MFLPVAVIVLSKRDYHPMTWRNIVAYWSMIGIATKSSRWEQKMNKNLLLMTESTAMATALTTSSTEQEGLAIKTSEKSAADNAQGAELEEESVALIEKSQADFEKANAEGLELKDVEAEIVLEEEEASAAAAEAAADELTYESEMAEGTADASEAFELEADAEGEAIGITVCEFIPFLDVVCDVVGSVSIVGFETTATAEAAKASAEFAAAAAAKADEDRNIALAAEVEAKVAEDEVVASGLKEEVATLEEKAAMERIQGEKLQVASETMFEQAEIEKETAAELEATAAAEEASATESSAKAVAYGVMSCWDAIMAGVSGAVALLYFIFRLITAYLIPLSVKSCFLVSRRDLAMERQRTSYFSMLKSLSRFFQHWIIFLVALGMFATALPDLANNSIKERGGIILLFGCICSSIDAVCIRIIPCLYLREEDFCYFAVRTISRFLAFAVLFTLELLLVWVAFGQSMMLLAGTVGSLNQIWFRISFGAILACHIVFFELQVCRSISGGYECGLSETTSRPSSHPSETDSLLPTDSSLPCHLCKDSHETTLVSFLRNRVKRDFCFLCLPFEALVLVCMIKLISHCIPSIVILWPTCNSLLLASKPKWLVPTLSILVLLSLSVSVYTTVRKFRRDGGDRKIQRAPRRKK